MKNKQVAIGVGYKVYFSDGRYFVDMYEKDKPIHSYLTIQGAKEALYYAGKINSKDAEI